MDQTRNERLLRPVVFLSRALLTSFCFALEMFCLDTTSLVPVSPIPFHELSYLFPGYFLAFLSSLHPVSHTPAFVIDFLTLSVPLILKCLPKMLGHRSRLLNAAVIPMHW